MSFYELFGYAIIALSVVTVIVACVIGVAMGRELRDRKRTRAEMLDRMRSARGTPLGPAMAEMSTRMWKGVADARCAAEDARRTEP